MKKLSLLLLLTIISLSSAAQFEYDTDSKQVQFAVDDIQAALSGLHKQDISIRFEIDPALGQQAYAITKRQGTVLVKGSDALGLMYGGLELAEQIRIFNSIDLIQESTGTPFIKQRGLKFNIPLDIRTPSYQDAGDAAQNNIAEMWNFEFWREYLDTMARHRYNVLTLWNPHPFPSMIALEDYPDIALQNVCGTSFPLDTDRTDEAEAKFIAGCGVSQQVLGKLIILKKISMPEKIQFWRKVMRHAKDRGIDIYFITWNIKLNSVVPPGWYRQQRLKMGDQGKYGINNDQENPRTITYLREAVRQFILTYPDLAGIGVTAGENMEDREDEYDREKWLWSTYGQGVLDAKKIQPDRQVAFIHRYWETDLQRIKDDFIDRYPDPINLGFKYARARMYATPTPHWADAYINEIRQHNLKSWWNIRNDDIFHFRWGDPVYAREFIKNLPPEDVTAGYYMGSDGYVWGREFISVHPNHSRDLEIRKHWFNFMLWGRLGYNPDLGETRIKRILHHHFPEMNVDPLYSAWTQASRIIPQINRFHWKSWDFMWALEGCLDMRKGFHTVIDFINTPPLEGSGILSIPDYTKAIQAGRRIDGKTPLDVADQLDAYGNTALKILNEVRGSDLVISKELSELLYDIEAMGYLGKYYAAKIRGGIHLHAFQVRGSSDEKQHAVQCLETALKMWKAYAHAATCNYRPQFMAKTRTIDWIRLIEDVRGDIEIAETAAQTHIQELDPNTQPTAYSSQPAPTVTPGAPISVYCDRSEPAIVFAAQDLKRILGKLGTVATLKPLSDLSGTPAGTYIVIAKSNTDLQAQLTAAGGQAVGALGEQDYALRVTGSENTKGYWALGGDRIGAMYGGIHIGEIVAAGSLANFQDEDKTPYIHKRGLKFNIPLDKRTPSFDDGGASAKTNRDDVWDLDFWKEYLDVIARQRFNVLSLWVRHPFPSILKVPGYEDVALNDGVEGDNGKKINHYTIDQKIEHWRQVLEMAYDRGIECWFVTWNIHTHGTEHTSYNWSQEPEYEPYLDESYKDYLKASVLAYFRTYPRMAGIGITAGENMRDKDDEGLPDDIREQWLWDTYGEAVMQIKNEDPSRKIRFVHRHWLSDYAEIADRFDRLPDGFEFSLKYSQARLYSSTNPPHAYKKLGKIANDKASWWNLRNDDIFIQRWGDPDFVKDFILSFPNEGAGCNRPPCITAGYVMGSDRYFWDRESMSKNPQTPRQLENEKHWYKFLLWGRLGYDPYTSRDLLKGLIQYRFPTVNASKVFDAWQAASRIIPMVNRFHYLSWDYQWWVEKGTGNSYSDINGYHNINAIITYKSKDISTVPQDKYIYTSIEDFVKGDHYGTSPLVIADSLEADGNAALTAVAGMTGSSNIELKETLGDIRSQAHFGIYWAYKIRGGVELERFRHTKNNKHKDNAIKHLQKALGEWKHYAAQLDASYEKVRFSGHGVFDWDAITSEVKKDIKIARNVE